jgi:hypothetical protein
MDFFDWIGTVGTFAGVLAVISVSINFLLTNRMRKQRIEPKPVCRRKRAARFPSLGDRQSPRKR